MPAREIVLLGNPALLDPSLEVQEAELEQALQIGRDLCDTMTEFRRERGWGRAISAPQIGIMKRVVYCEYGGKEVLLNPVLSEFSDEVIEIWDDCMSFPELLVKVRRHKTCRVTYRDRNWKLVSRKLENAESELLQHEVDHLNGIVATMRAIDGSQFALQSQRSFLGDDGFANVV